MFEHSRELQFPAFGLSKKLYIDDVVSNFLPPRPPMRFLHKC